MSRGGATVLISAAALAGCGGSEERGPEEPRLPHALAEALAAQSEEIAARLDAGDSCGAAQEAAALEATALAAIDDGRVPAALEAALEAGVSELLGQIRCEEAGEDDHPGKGKGKGKGKNGKGKE